MLYQSQAEINMFFVGVIQRVAASPKVAIQDWDMKSTVELLQEIDMLNADLFALLESFLKAYQAWYDVHVQIDKAGTAGNLTPQQNQDLNAAIVARDATRKDLLAAI
ncbi:MAG: hypothetical protein K2Y10_02615 [Burkholderiaceae bacterium]|nr:hypothetical protein [Burkholderiaceae bacterium]